MPKNSDLHEMRADNEEITVGSERSFGIVFTIVFTILGLWPVFWGQMPRIWALVIAASFLCISFLKPDILKPLNHLWFRFGLILHKIVNPIVMGILFFGIITPIAIWLRLTRKDLLRLKIDPQASSHWINRSPPGPKPDTMLDQF